MALNRRTFLCGALVAAGAGLAATLPLAGCASHSYVGPPGGLVFLSPKQWTVLDAAGRRLWPASHGRPGAGELEVATVADRLFSRANPRLKGDLRQLLDTIEDQTWLALRLTPFTAMTPAEQDAYLATWRDSPVGLMRQAFVGLNRIAGMLSYMAPGSWPAIGYPGPWIGRVDLGLGPDNQGALAANPNPNIYRHFA